MRARLSFLERQLCVWLCLLRQDAMRTPLPSLTRQDARLAGMPARLAGRLALSNQDLDLPQMRNDLLRAESPFRHLVPQFQAES
jgi:hypothetical protein